MKRMIAKLIILVFATLCCQYILTHFLLQIDDSRLNRYFFRFNEYTRLIHYLKKKIDIIYLGDSTTYFVDAHDTDKRKIGQMIRCLAPGYSLAQIAHPAYQADIYLEFCRYIARQPYHPAMIIIPINMRSFSPVWDKQGDSQFEIEKIVLRGGFAKQVLLAIYKPLKILNTNFHAISPKEFSNTPVFNGTVQVGRVKDFNNPGFRKHSDDNMKKKILLYYMFSLSPHHRKVKSLVAIAKTLASKKIKCIFYLTPIDVNTGEKYFPGGFSRRLAENAALLQSLLAAEGFELLDISAALPSSTFFWYPYPNEHLRQTGRKYVAEKISQRILALSRIQNRSIAVQ